MESFAAELTCISLALNLIFVIGVSDFEFL